MSHKVDLVLLQSVKGLGNKDDIVSVAIPYAKNVLLAQGKAKVADKQALDTMKQKKEKQQKTESEAVHAFDELSERVKNGGTLKISKKSTPAGHLYEKVSVKDIYDALSSTTTMHVDSSRIVMKEKIESIGETIVQVHYKGKTIKVPLTVL